jgi:DNA invertase Pin-like site-specific DNA recombinase
VTRRKRKTDEPLRLIGYGRVSTEKQAEHGLSLDVQDEKIRGYAALYEHRLVDIVHDDASGKTLRRKGLQSVLERLERGEADGLLVPKLDRLTRRLKDLGYLLEEYFQGGRYALISVAESLDTETATGRMVANMLTLVSQWEREVIGERTKEVLSHLREQGVVLGRHGLGFRRAGRMELARVPEEERVVDLIVELHGANYTVRQIAEHLREAGLPTKKGGRWWPTTVHRVLSRRRPAH